MNIKEFTKKVRDEISHILDKDVGTLVVDKFNGVKWHGIVIKDENGNDSPTFYMDPYLDTFSETGDWNFVIQQILNQYHSASFPKSIDTEWYKDFDNVKDLIFSRIINYEINTASLVDIPYTRYLDFAIVYCIRCIGTDFYTGDYLIRNDLLTYWNLTVADIDRLARENTPRLFPLRIESVAEILGLLYRADNGFPIMEDPIDLHFMSNTKSLFGAATILYENCLKEYASDIGKDLIILPSSVHEVLLLPYDDNADIGTFKEMVYDVNRTEVNRVDFLSDNVYLYRRDTDLLEIV